jgi:hypothetical protein
VEQAKKVLKEYLAFPEHLLLLTILLPKKAISFGKQSQFEASSQLSKFKLTIDL